jgi:hypothetical protein
VQAWPRASDAYHSTGSCELELSPAVKFIVMNVGEFSVDGTSNSNVVGAESAVQGLRY